MITRTRAVFAIVAFLFVPPAVVLLAALGRWPGAAVLSLLFFGYVAVEVVSWLRRERTRRRRRYVHLRRVGRPLADVTYSREDWVA